MAGRGKQADPRGGALGEGRGLLLGAGSLLAVMGGAVYCGRGHVSKDRAMEKSKGRGVAVLPEEVGT